MLFLCFVVCYFWCECFISQMTDRFFREENNVSKQDADCVAVDVLIICLFHPSPRDQGFVFFLLCVSFVCLVNVFV